MMGFPSMVLRFAVLTGWLFIAGPVAEDVEQQLRKSLESMGAVPWYDAEEDSLEPVPVKPRLDDSTNRESRWIPKPKKETSVAPNAPKPTQPGGQNTGGQLPGFWSAVGTLLGDFSQVIGWVILALLIATVVGGLVYAFSKMEGDDAGSPSMPRTATDQLDEADEVRLENLPVQLQRPTGDLLSESDRLRDLGRLPEAIIYLFGHRLLQLDRAHAIRLARGKTNRQYLSELRGRKELERVLFATVQVFEQSYFGSYQITSSQYDEVRKLQGPFETALAAQKEAA